MFFVVSCFALYYYYYYSLYVAQERNILSIICMFPQIDNKGDFDFNFETE